MKPFGEPSPVLQRLWRRERPGGDQRAAPREPSGWAVREWSSGERGEFPVRLEPLACPVLWVREGEELSSVVGELRELLVWPVPRG